MSAAEQWSARWSARVELAAANGEASGTKQSDKGPERLSSRVAPRGKAAQRVGTRRLHAVARELSPRDRAILRSLAEWRLLSTSQLQRLHFAEHATEGAASRICRRVLQRLKEHRLIEHLERQIGGIRAGSASFVWRLGPVGDRLLRQNDDDGVRARRKEPSLHHVEHVLAASECYVQLVEAARAGQLELLAVEPEPVSWRRYSGPHGAPEILKPDLAAVTASGEYEDHWFIEVDRGTESLPTLLSKCAQYERYRRTGREQHERAVFPAVLWLVPDERRRDRLRHGVERARDLDASVFRIALTAEFLDIIRGGAAEQEQLTERR